MNKIDIRQRTDYDDFVESENGLAEALGLEHPTRSALSAVLMRPLMWLAGRTSSGVQLDDVGVSIQGVLRRWSEFGLTYETEHLICVVLTKNAGPLVLKKAALDEAGLAEVRNLVSRHVAANEETGSRIRAIRTGQIAPERPSRG